MGKKDLILFFSIFCVLALISGSTFAYWGWQSDENKGVVFNTSHGVDKYFVYDEGASRFVGDFQASSSHCGGKSNTIAFAKTSEVDSEILTATIKLTVNSIQTNIKNSNYVKWAVTAGDSSSCGETLSTGTFKGKSNDSEITLLSTVNGSSINVMTYSQSNGTKLTKSQIDSLLDPKSSSYATNLNNFRTWAKANGNMFTVWIWIDSSASTSHLKSLSGETLDVNMWTQIDMTSVD